MTKTSGDTRVLFSAYLHMPDSNGLQETFKLSDFLSKDDLEEAMYLSDEEIEGMLREAFTDWLFDHMDHYIQLLAD